MSHFGTKGSDPGQHIYPLGIIIDGSNLMYIAEQNNHRISIFTNDGQFVCSFGGQHFNNNNSNDNNNNNNIIIIISKDTQLQKVFK